MNKCQALFPLVFIVASHSAYSASSELCNEILKRNGAFNLVIKDASKSASEFTYEWLRTATWEEFKKKQDAGLKIVLPIEGVPVGAEGTYTEDQFRTFTQLRDQGKLRNFTKEEFSRSVSLTASPIISNAWLECMKINQDPRGMTCWAESDDRLENGAVVFKARYFPDSPASATEPLVASKNGFIVLGGTALTPLDAGDKIPLGGVSVTIKREKKSVVTVVLNSEERGSCDTVKFPSIGDVLPPFKIQIFSNTSPVAAHPQVTVGLPLGYKLIGGGAQVNWRGNGNLLVASYPAGNTWTAQAKDHEIPDPSTLTAWAIGLEDSKDQWEVKIEPKSMPSIPFQAGSVTARLPPGFIRTGGGAAAEFGGQGRLLTSSYPKDSLEWTVTDKDHVIPEGGTLTAYVIGIKSRLGLTPEVQEHTGTGVLAQHPTGSSSLDLGYILTGGGARTSCTQGNLLTGSFPLDSTTWHAEAKDHNVICPSTIDVWSIGLKLPPGSLSIEGGTPEFGKIYNFGGAMAISPIAVPAMRPTILNTTTPKLMYYFSQPGDTFLTLALRFYNNTDWKTIMDANPSAPGSLTITPGTKILLPGK